MGWRFCTYCKRALGAHSTEQVKECQTYGAQFLPVHQVFKPDRKKRAAIERGEYMEHWNCGERD